MPRNRKLTKVIAGRTVEAATVEPGGVLVLFDDQSNMKIKTGGAAALSPGSKVNSVHEAKPSSKSSLRTVRARHSALADPGSSVAVRDRNNAVEYLG